MPNLTRLGKGATRKINAAIEELFDNAAARLLGPQAIIGKKIYIGFQRELSLPGVFEAGAREEYVKPDLEVLHSLIRVAHSYIEAHKERTKARVVHEINGALAEAKHKGGMSRQDFRDLVNTKLADVWAEVTRNVHAIVDTELAHAKNVSVLDGILGSNLNAGIDDPVVYFVVVRDDDLCDECKRLHLMDDGKTPRLWKLSELGHGYHHKGEDNPKVGGLHPHCRCTLVTLLPSYGFSVDGKVKYVKRGYLALPDQRGLVRSEEHDGFEPLAKAWDPAGHPRNLKGQFVVKGLQDGHHELSDDPDEAQQQLEDLENSFDHGTKDEHVQHQIDAIKEEIEELGDEAKAFWTPEYVEQWFKEAHLWPDSPEKQKKILDEIFGELSKAEPKFNVKKNPVSAILFPLRNIHRAANPGDGDFLLPELSDAIQLFRAHKVHALHPYSQALRFALHALDNVERFKNPAQIPAVEKEFERAYKTYLELRKDSGKKVVDPVPIYTLRSFFIRHPHIVKQLIEHKQAVQAALEPLAVNIHGKPSVLLVRGMASDRREPDPVLSSYADSKQYIGDTASHHFANWVPVDKIVYSFDLGPHGAHELPYRSAEDEYLVMPHELVPGPMDEVKKLIDRKNKEVGNEKDYNLPKLGVRYGLPAADTKMNRGAGAIIYAKDTGRFLVGHRSTRVHMPNTWGTFGGYIGGVEDPEEGALREIKEEIGYPGKIDFHKVYVSKDDKTGFEYHNFIGVVDKEFQPKLNYENQAAKWVKVNQMPTPQHPGLTAMVNHPKFKAALDKAKASPEGVRLASSEKPMEKSLKAILPGQKMPLDYYNITSRGAIADNEFDYSHLLPDEFKNQGYKLRVTHTIYGKDTKQPTHWLESDLYKEEPRYSDEDITKNFIRKPREKWGEHENKVYNRAKAETRRTLFGHAVGQVSGKTLRPHFNNGVTPEMRGHGMGKILYNALFGHAHNALGAKFVAGNYHSEQAAHVHESLSRQHGMNYHSATVPITTIPSDLEQRLKGYAGQDAKLARGPYRYAMKDELNPTKPKLPRLPHRRST